MSRGTLAGITRLRDLDDLSRCSPFKNIKKERQNEAHVLERLKMADFKRLPVGAFPIRLVGEGAANAVFELGFPEGCSATTQFRGWLLRIAKDPLKESSPESYYFKQQTFYLDEVRPLLGGYAIKQELVSIPDHKLIPQLNAHLRRIDATRGAKFRGSYVTATNWGLLVEDLCPSNPRDYMCIEFKPKWLSQSPSAPPGAIRCRQCAMELFNFIKNPQRNRKPPESKHCPLVFGHANAPPEVAILERTAPELAETQNPKDAFAKILQHDLFRQLREAQDRSDPHGPLSASADDAKFVLAMTIRDCTCFVSLPRRGVYTDPDRPLELRLCDFDWKNPSAKIERWRRAERDLISSGCYTADWILCGQQLYHAPTRCMLEWIERSRKDRPLEVIHVQNKTSLGAKEPESWTKYLADLGRVARVHHIHTQLAALEEALLPYSKDNPKNGTCPYRAELPAQPKQP